MKFVGPGSLRPAPKIGVLLALASLIAAAAIPNAAENIEPLTNGNVNLPVE